MGFKRAPRVIFQCERCGLNESLTAKYYNRIKAAGYPLLCTCCKDQLRRVVGKESINKVKVAASVNTIEMNGCRITRSVPKNRCDDYLHCLNYSECLGVVAKRLWAGFVAERIP